MNDAIANRGPDDDGYWSSEDVGIALGHRRLSIVDLSCEGHQPMTSGSGRYVTIYNGEIYNFEEIRANLVKSGATFRGHSDTEVMLAAFEQWGLIPALTRLTGMFALAVWDRSDRKLHLIRDRVGEKPLYYGVSGKTLLFGSELKALRKHPRWQGNIDRNALALYLRHNYVPGPYSIYEGIRKVSPGTVVTFAQAGAEPGITRYWSARDAVENGLRNPLEGSDSEMVDALENVLRKTIRQEMVADVPLGAFLSGGIDSSTIVALMQAESSRPVKTFTIGFHEQAYNEAAHAKNVARHLGTDHTELYVTARQTLDVITRLPAIYDEPFADSSQVPTFLVSQLARRDVTVSLSGDGGDELFAGYNRYVWTRRLWSRLRRLPRPLRVGAGAAARAISPQRWNSVAGPVMGFVPQRFRVSLPGDKIHKAAGILGAENVEALYRQLITHWPDPGLVALGGTEKPTVLTDSSGWPETDSAVSRMMYLDLMSYLPDDIMVKVDRASMAVSLEARAPFLDHRVAEFAWRIPLEVKMRDGAGKWPLRQILYRHVPREIVDRPKMGFGIPIDRWLRGELRDWAESLLGEERLEREGYFNAGIVTEKWREHRDGIRNWHYLLWDVLMFQAWLEAQ